MAQQSLRPAREDGGHPAAAAHDAGMADGINPAINGVKSSCRDPVVDGVPAEPEGKKLPAGDNAMLARREGGNHQVRVRSTTRRTPPGWAVLTAYIRANTAHVRHFPDVGASRCARVGTNVTKP